MEIEEEIIKADFFQFVRLDDLQCYFLVKKLKIFSFYVGNKVFYVSIIKLKILVKIGRKIQRGFGCWCVGEGMREKEVDFFEVKI